MSIQNYNKCATLGFRAGLLAGFLFCGGGVLCAFGAWIVATLFVLGGGVFTWAQAGIGRYVRDQTTLGQSDKENNSDQPRP